jgi:hypothetical protein
VETLALLRQLRVAQLLPFDVERPCAVATGGPRAAQLHWGDRIKVEAGLDAPMTLDATIKKWPVKDGRSR